MDPTRSDAAFELEPTFLTVPGDHRPMNAMTGVGAVLTLAGFGAYVLGVMTPYPGRAFSVTALMVGITLAAIGRSANGGETA